MPDELILVTNEYTECGDRPHGVRRAGFRPASPHVGKKSRLHARRAADGQRARDSGVLKWDEPRLRERCAACGRGQ